MMALMLMMMMMMMMMMMVAMMMMMMLMRTLRLPDMLAPAVIPVTAGKNTENTEKKLSPLEQNNLPPVKATNPSVGGGLGVARPKVLHGRVPAVPCETLKKV